MRRQQLIGASIVCCVIFLIVAVTIALPRCGAGEEQGVEAFRLDTLLADSLEQAWQDAHPPYQKPAKPVYKRPYVRDTVPLLMQPFDPNTADSLTLLQLGLRPWQVRNMLRYRAKGGVYRLPEDLKKLYGMTDSMFAALQPWIQITSLPADSLVQPVKLGHEKRDTVLNLNTADTASLQFIRGIGPTMARRIVQYRDRLGGYASVSQLSEIKGLADSVQACFVVEPAALRLIYVNSATLSVLVRHPYISYEQAKQLADLHRRLTIRDESVLLKRGIFSPEELARLRPYLSFDK